MAQLQIWEKNMETKKDIRNRILGIREQLTQEEWNSKSRQIYQRVVKHPLFLASEEIYCYINFRHEVDTLGILHAAWQLGKKVAAPKVTGKEMEFYYISSPSDLAEGYCKIMEPVTGRIADASEALVIMPGAAFDRECHRIGYGGGFYDKYLERHPQYARLALAFDLQITDHIPADSYDIKPEVIITESGSVEEELYTDRWL